ncbi:MAG: hypothetical protein R3F21_14855 [Myxococcota bacterium]
MWGLVSTILTIAYPLIVLWALAHHEPRQVAVGVMVLLALRAGIAALRRGPGRSGPRRPGARIPWTLATPVVLVLLVTALTAVWNDPLGLLLAPVFVNAALLASFALSLRGRPIVESIARLQVDRLAPAEVRYCRQVTVIWCAFFFVNGAITLALALAKRIDAWALYTGLVSYVLMGLLFAAEWIVRHARFRRYVGAWSDPLLSRIFPPNLAPGIVGIDEGGGAAARTIRLEVPTGLACWPGHFPDRPILPGVVQIDWALREIERWRGSRPSFTAVEALKFKHPVLPGESLLLELTAAGDAVEFRFVRDAQEVSRGRIRCAPSPSEGSEGASEARPSPPLVGTGGWPAPEQVLVHRPPMIWLRAIEGHDARETSASVAVADCGALRDADGGVAAHVAIEWMAQCVAAHAGIERRAGGEAPTLGLLLGSRHVRFARSAYNANERFRVVATRSWGDDRGAVSFDCRVEEIASGEPVAAARLSCFVPGDESEVDAMPERSDREWATPGGAIGTAAGVFGSRGGIRG